jgi:hypothetical protein
MKLLYVFKESAPIFMGSHTVACYHPRANIGFRGICSVSRGHRQEHMIWEAAEAHRQAENG